MKVSIEVMSMPSVVPEAFAGKSVPRVGARSARVTALLLLLPIDTDER